MKAQTKTRVLPLIVTWLAVAIYAHPGMSGFATLSLSMVRFGTLRIDHYRNLSLDQSYVDGHYYYGRPPGYSFLAVPTAFVVHLIWKALPERLQSRLEDVVAARYREGTGPTKRLSSRDSAELLLVCYLAVLTVSGVCASWLVATLHRFLGDFPMTESRRFVAAIAPVLGTIIGVYAASNWNQVASATLAFWCFYRLYRAKDTPLTNSAALICGSLLGFTLLFEYQAVLIVAILFVYGLSVLSRKAWLPFVTGLLLGPAAVMAYHTVCFHSPFKTPYNFPSDLNYWGTRAVHKAGFLGMGFPTLTSLLQFLFSPKYGYFFFMPLCAIGLVYALVTLVRDRNLRAEAAVAVCAFAAYWLGASTADPSFGGTVFGPRFMMMSVPFTAFFGVLGLTKKGPWTAVVALAIFLSVLVSFIGIQYPMPEMEMSLASNPFREVYWPMIKDHGVYSVTVETIGQVLHWGKNTRIVANATILLFLVSAVSTSYLYTRRSEALPSSEHGTDCGPEPSGA